METSSARRGEENEFSGTYPFHTLLIRVTTNVHLESLAIMSIRAAWTARIRENMCENNIDASEDYDEDFPIDLALLEEGQSLSQVVSSVSEKPLTAGIENAIAAALAPEGNYAHFTEESPAASVNRLAKINFIKNLKMLTSSTSARAQMVTENRNNSKDEPTLFTFACPNARFGWQLHQPNHKYYQEQKSCFSVAILRQTERKAETLDRHFKLYFLFFS